MERFSSALLVSALLLVAKSTLALAPPNRNLPNGLKVSASGRHAIPRTLLRASQAENEETPDEDDTKFGFGQRIESIKTAAVGAVAGGFALAPAAAVHDLLLAQKGLAQWEFDTDTGALEAALFAIVYRYCIRKDDNPQLNDGVVGAFVLTRTLTRIQTPVYCTAAPLDCGAPTGYFDWSMLWGLAVNGAESAVLFGASAAAMEYCFQKGYIGKFPG